MRLRIDVPPLDETDPLVRQLVQALSSHPRIAAWLATEGLIRQFTVVAHSIEDGRSPVGQLKVLRPSFPLGLTERRDGLYLDALSYTRYNAFADAVASVDPPGAARTYATLKPRIEEAHRELGFPDVPFNGPLSAPSSSSSKHQWSMSRSASNLCATELDTASPIHGWKR